MKKRALKKLFSRRKRVQASRDNRGFTLLELIIAMAIFAVITIPIMNMFSKSAELNGMARKVQNTNDAASSIAETIKAADLFDAFNLKGEKDSVAPESTKLIALFGADGVITTDLTAPVQTKNELGENYGMKKYAGSAYEWNEQAAAFAQYVTGKTAADVAGMAVAEGKPADADLAATVTIAVGGFQALIEKAAQ